MSHVPLADFLSRDPTVAIVTKAKGTFFKPLYEALAAAQSAPWKTLLVWPQELTSEHPAEAITPQGINLQVAEVSTPTVSHRISATGDQSLTFLPSAALWRLLGKHNIRAILIHEYSPYTLGALLFAKLRRIPVVVSSEIGESNAHYFGWRTRQWHRFWRHFVDGVVACSPAALSPLSRRTLPSIAAYHAVDSRVYRPFEIQPDRSAAVVFAYLGQLIPRKGLDLLLDAANRLLSKNVPPFTIRIIGGGEQDSLRALAAQLGLRSHVEFTGFLSGSALREALGSADVFVFPTKQDTYGAVVHEAACLGLPLLVSRYAGAAKALVEEGGNGYVIDPENAERFAECMAQLMDGPLRQKMSIRSRTIGEILSAHLRGKALWEWMQNNVNP